MNPLVGVLLLVLAGLLGARVFDMQRAPLGPRLLVSSGTHFIFLGFLLGSAAFGLLTREVIDFLYPFLALGLGWIGLLFGLQLDRRQLARFPAAYLALTVVQAGLAFLVFLTVGAAVIAFLDRVTPELRIALLTTSATACVSTPAGVALINRTFLLRGRLSELLMFMASLDALIGIVALQLTYSLYHGGAAADVGEFGWALWLAIAVGAGLIAGVFFLWLTRPKPEREELTMFLLGLVVFVSGAALYLGISPLFVASIAGVVIANLSPSRRRVYGLLQNWEKPIYVILLILAGALLTFPTWLILPLAAAYVLLRAAGKVTGGLLAARLARPRLTLPRGLGLGLISQGGISLAMIISITLTYGALEFRGLPLAEVLFSTVVLAVTASELVGPFLTRDLLRRAGEISPRVETALAEGEDPAGGGSPPG